MIWCRSFCGFPVMRFLSNSSCLARTSYAPRLLFSPLSQYAFSTYGRNQRSQKWPKSKPPGYGQHPMTKFASEKLNILGEIDSVQPHSEPPTRKQKADTRRAYAIFHKLAENKFDELIKEADWQSQYEAFGITSKLDFHREARLFRVSISKACELAAETHAVSRVNNPLFWSLRNAFVTRDVKGLSAELKFSFQSFLSRSQFPKSIDATHQKIADMRFPYEWYPATRALQRTVHLHVGPTNSGKTYNALKALENAKSGIYAGPLRLLAHEVYSRFMAKGKPCALITGEEQRIPQEADSYFISCTVEMTPVNEPVDVAVIDEIQMIGDDERGWAWTQAFFGIQAKELHLCGEERTVELIQSFCATLGDECIVHRYQRLSGLETMHESLNGKFTNLRKGDAVVAFSRLELHALKRSIERHTNKRCAIIYGSLPPETRAQQAALFNDLDNDYDYLVASDAIGMGLNLEIRRVVFLATTKRSPTGYRQLSVSEVKQIGGRAGRFRTTNHAVRAATEDSQPPDPKPSGPGLVTAMEDEDLALVIQSFDTEAEPIKTAGIQPPAAAIERFSAYFPPNTPLSFMLVRLRAIAKLSPRFHFCHPLEMLEVADLIQPFPMSIYDRCVILNAPVALRDPQGQQVLQAFARCVARMEGGNLLDLREVELELLDAKFDQWKEGAPELLRRLEALHKSITLYLWLSYRFSGVFTSQHLAFHVKAQVETKINDYLSGVQQTDSQMKKRLDNMRKAAQAQQLREKQYLGETAPPEGSGHEGVGEWNEEGHEEPLYEDSSQLEDITPLPEKSDRWSRR
ncbi:P-loop containing nucleoside triphosphate hydrolase protein [Xylaria bambusicola]|uniref:P-loop containing nucleoside triphosphate hydrolase protein n=1 Tax=Xylaria bambusicola TaxID=326684 RepID=UPI002007D509|nr:P-loop containing nucleoside triphosphate hydrolase protein [Xylaria bambusicola]KAI0520904.1 P-loop containing nucleoside triphosphate hydrolase protein [Xylaria bambusicola]